MLRIDMLPAGYGDCLWIEYGDKRSPCRILIDGGIAGTYDAICKRIADAREKCHFELVIISHVDADHIEGIVKLLANPPEALSIGDVWFNGWCHLPAAAHSRLGPPQGEMLTACLSESHLPWNTRFGGKAVVVPDAEPLPELALDGGMKLTLLSPTLKQLRALRPVWEKECKANGLIPGSLADARAALRKDRKLGPRRLGEGINVRQLAAAPYKPNDSKSNGSSIAVLAEFDGKRCVLGADAFPEVLLSSLRRLPQEDGEGKIKVDAYKMSHHGSRFNNSPDLLDAMQCNRYLISTDGEKHGHPDRETIARVLACGNTPVVFCFNYKSAQTRSWDDSQRRKEFRYEVRYPDSADGGLTIEL